MGDRSLQQPYYISRKWYHHHHNHLSPRPPTPPKGVIIVIILVQTPIPPNLMMEYLNGPLKYDLYLLRL